MSSLREPSLRRTRPVCLRDIPAEDRLKAARLAMRTYPDAGQELLAAALMPSDKTYYVCDDRLAA